MRVRIKTDGTLDRRFRDAAQAAVEINQALADETLALIDQGFEHSRDPWDDAWAPLVLREGDPLEDTGELRASWRTEPKRKGGFTVVSDKAHSKFHQRGTGLYGPKKRRIYPKAAKYLWIPGHGAFASVAGSPARKMVPDSGGELPPRWARRYDVVTTRVLRRLLRGGASVRRRR